MLAPAIGALHFPLRHRRQQLLAEPEHGLQALHRTQRRTQNLFAAALRGPRLVVAARNELDAKTAIVATAAQDHVIVTKRCPKPRRAHERDLGPGDWGALGIEHAARMRLSQVLREHCGADEAPQCQGEESIAGETNPGAQHAGHPTVSIAVWQAMGRLEKRETG